MKQFVILALVGLAQSVKISDFDTWTGRLPVQRATYDVTSDEFKATKWDKKNPHPGFQPHDHEFEGVEHKGAYER